MRRLALGENYDLIRAGPPASGAPVTLSWHPPGPAPAHEHAAAYACVVLAGGFVELSGPRETWCATGELMAHEAGERHANHIGPDGALCLNLHLDLGAPAAPVRLDPLARGLADALAQEGFRGTDALTWDALAAELQHRLTKAQTPRRDPAAVGTVVAALDAEPARRWSLEALAAVAERHPTHLARAFRQETGASLGAWARRQRLLRLCAELRGDTPLAELAARHGYADQAHMTREFRAAMGTTPAAWRRLRR